MSPMMNKYVSDKFALSSSNLHRIITGRRYAGGHESAKTKTEDHGEKFVKVTVAKLETRKGKGRGKSSSATVSAVKGSDKPTGSKVTVTKVALKLMPLPFLDDPPSEGTQGAKKRKKDDGSKGDE